jgi:beta-glucosidase
LLGHCFGRHAPGRSSDRKISPEGDSYSEPWIVGHNLLLSHAVTVKLYREQYAAKAYGGGAGKIGLVVNMNWGGESRVQTGNRRRS